MMAREGKAKVLSEAEFKLVLLVAKVGKFATRNTALVYCLVRFRFTSPKKLPP
ncbi:hypothetical protein LDG_5526 [Legionella drancourtii LLAP12]|uniref:Uncharacterized protein n=1 Tax=Legionella drancourtii LLAP12 TaxID=658187 RepID=G9EK05_9GAMM|nr:hypothetical protein LDG_5526 [Legionella drancourtii LLAP12]